MKIATAIPVLLGTVPLGSISHASTTYTDEPTFLAALVGGYTTETFDSYGHLVTLNNLGNGLEPVNTGRTYNEQANPSGGAARRRRALPHAATMNPQPIRLRVIARRMALSASFFFIDSRLS